MKQLILRAVLVLYISFPNSVLAEPPPEIKAAAQDIIKAIFKKVAALPEAASYSHFLSTEELQWQLEPCVSLDPREGWLAMGSVAKGVSVQLAKSPGQGALRSETVFADNNSFALDVFIANGQGDANVQRTMQFHLSEKPQLIIAYFLQTKSKDVRLERAISSLIESQRQIVSERLLQIPK